MPISSLACRVRNITISVEVRNDGSPECFLLLRLGLRFKESIPIIVGSDKLIGLLSGKESSLVWLVGISIISTTSKKMLVKLSISWLPETLT